MIAQEAPWWEEGGREREARARERERCGSRVVKGGTGADATRMMRCNHKPHSGCSGVCQHTHIHIPLSVSSMTQIEHAGWVCVCFSPPTLYTQECFLPFCLKPGRSSCTVWLVGCGEEVLARRSCRILLPLVSLFKLRSNVHFEQRTWLVASGVKAFPPTVTTLFDLKRLH